MGELGKFASAERIDALMYDNQKHAHVIVCGNEKGGSGKTTTSMHIVVSLLKCGFKVATIDLDSRQKSLSRYIKNRSDWSKKHDLELDLPNHFRFDQAQSDSMNENQTQDFSLFLDAVAKVENDHDFVVIDTPGADGYLMRLSHSLADTLVTPLNDSFVDLDVLGRVDAESMHVADVSHYALMVREARRQRRKVDEGLLDWVVVRNRMSALASRNEHAMDGCIRELSLQLGFRIAEGINERVIFREYFPMGLTALDDIGFSALDGKPTASHFAARKEIRKLIAALRLPIDERGRQRAEARQIWLERSKEPIDLPDIFAD